MKATLTVTIEEDLHDRITSEAKRRETPVSWFAEKVLRKGLEIIDLETGKHPIPTANTKGDR